MTARAKLGWSAAVVAVLAAVGAWRFGGVGGGNFPIDPGDTELRVAGAAVYARECAACHGRDLEGQPGWRRRGADGRLPAPPHDASGHTWHHPDQLLFRITRDGGQAVAPAGFVSAMPAFGDRLGDREIRAVIAYIKSTWPEDIRRRQAEITRRASGIGGG